MARESIKDQRIQALRGLAAMLVVILHARETLVWLKRPGWLVARLVPDNGFGALGVDLFFVISGVVMAMALQREIPLWHFLRARFTRIVPSFWLAAIITIGLSVSLGDPLTIERLANSITILPLYDLGTIDTPLPPVGWTLAFELFFYLIVALAFRLPVAVRFDAVVAALLLCALIGELLQPILIPIVGIAFNAMHLEFALGLIAFRATRRPSVARYRSMLIIAGVLPLAYSIVVGAGFSNAPEAVVAGQTSIARVLAWGLPSAALIAGLIARPDHMTVNNQWAKLGDASYAIYLVHWPIMMALPLIWPWKGPISSDLLFAMFVGTGAVAGILAHRYVERPLLARLRTRPGKDGAKAPIAAKAGA